MDDNGDGYVTYLEFEQAFKGNAFALQDGSQLRTMFDGYDMNTDGRLEAAELSGNATPSE
ncbi:hypothetical protein WAB17_03545 [Parerythrobacter aurantius]|uniref:hypothetical protein n=1 Tax=Parerythrobacter aurantius TaxID=3127706 RepID=UPI003246512F